MMAERPRYTNRERAKAHEDYRPEYEARNPTPEAQQGECPHEWQGGHPNLKRCEFCYRCESVKVDGYHFVAVNKVRDLESKLREVTAERDEWKRIALAADSIAVDEAKLTAQSQELDQLREERDEHKRHFDEQVAMYGDLLGEADQLRREVERLKGYLARRSHSGDCPRSYNRHTGGVPDACTCGRDEAIGFPEHLPCEFCKAALQPQEGRE